MVPRALAKGSGRITPIGTAGLCDMPHAHVSSLEIFPAMMPIMC